MSQRRRITVNSQPAGDPNCTLPALHFWQDSNKMYADVPKTKPLSDHYNSLSLSNISLTIECVTHAAPNQDKFTIVDLLMLLTAKRRALRTNAKGSGLLACEFPSHHFVFDPLVEQLYSVGDAIFCA